MSASGCATLPRAVSRAEAMADVATIERILRRGYAGYEVAGRNGLDWERLFREARLDVERLAVPIAPALLRETLGKRFSALGDNHVAFWDYAPKGWSNWRSTGHHDDAFTADLVLIRKGDSWVVVSGQHAGARLTSCEGWALSEIVRPSVSDDLKLIHRLIVLAERAPPALKCQIVRPGGRRRPISLSLRRVRVALKEPPRPPIFEQHSGAAARVRLRSLDESHLGALEAFVASANKLRAAPAVVLDVRGNNGGSDTWVTRWFAELTNHELRYSTIEELQSEVTLQGDVNTAVCDRSSGGDDEKSRARAERRLKEARDDLAGARRKPGWPYREWRVRTPVERGKAPMPYPGRLVLLADARCASACETFVLYARQIAGVVTVGENTGGVGAFGDVRLYRLPHSGIGFSAGKKWFHATDPRALAPESRGYLPDLWLDTEQAPQLAERFARCLADPKCAARFRPGLGRAADATGPSPSSPPPHRARARASWGRGYCTPSFAARFLHSRR